MVNIFRTFRNITIVALSFLLILTTIGFVIPLDSVDAQTNSSVADQLQQQINDHNATIQQLQQEISQYQAELNKTSAQSKSLQSAIAQLDLNSKKLQASLTLTQNQIDQTNLKIQQLSLGINNKQSDITSNQKALGETIKNINETDGQSLIEALFNYSDLASFMNQIDTIEQFQSKVQDNVNTLKGLKQGLETNKSQSEIERDNLVKLEANLKDQQTSIELNKKQEATLLTQTKNKESNYQALIADRQSKEKQFEQELTQYESQLKLIINPGSYPSPQSGIFSWPLDPPHRITQLFGNTEFSATHAQLYNGQGHNGIDIAAPIGTPVKAALDGVVKGTGDTDKTCPGASFGKWVMIQHPNGLSSLYAHLSLIKAVTGQQVSTGDTIGYSGMTGYATGPHLHFTVYATQGVEIMSRASAACSGAVYTMPIADLKAYLNPLSYLVYP